MSVGGTPLGDGGFIRQRSASPLHYEATRTPLFTDDDRYVAEGSWVTWDPHLKLSDLGGFGMIARDDRHEVLLPQRHPPGAQRRQHHIGIVAGHCREQESFAAQPSQHRGRCLLPRWPRKWDRLMGPTPGAPPGGR